MAKNTKILLCSLLLLILTISFALAFTFQCDQSCQRGCWCSGNWGGSSDGPCCGVCINEWWFGRQYLWCCSVCGTDTGGGGGGGGDNPIYPKF